MSKINMFYQWVAKNECDPSDIKKANRLITIKGQLGTFNVYQYFVRMFHRAQK